MGAPEALTLANPHALSAIVEASASRTIVASEDIYDEHGRKLWARDQAISASLQQRLLERKLSRPLESCLRAADGITTHQLHEGIAAFVESAHPLARVVQPQAAVVLEGVGQLPLHSAVQLLLTTVHATRPEVYQHALVSMALAGALSAAAGQARFDLRMALLTGLLHDLGEMYLDPRYLDSSQPLDAAGYRHVVTHPLIGRMLLLKLTDYPPALAEAVAEHHERLDGTGYPARKLGPALSPLGRMQAVVEATVGMVASARAPLARTALALRMVPGEFDDGFTSALVNAARQAGEDLQEAVPHDDPGESQAKLMELRERLERAVQVATDIAAARTATAPVRALAERALHRLRRLQVAGHAIGLWTVEDAGNSLPERFELSVALGEMRYRLGGVRRDCLWSETGLSEAENKVLEPLWTAIA
jgi:HD-GYP domain-containing protein (c-di-GMP phosphodiesterase class II)